MRRHRGIVIVVALRPLGLLVVPLHYGSLLLSVPFGFSCSLGVVLGVLGTRRRSRGFQPSERSRLDHVDIIRSSASSMNRTTDSKDGFLKMDDFMTANLTLFWAYRVNYGMYLNTMCSRLASGRELPVQSDDRPKAVADNCGARIHQAAARSIWSCR